MNPTQKQFSLNRGASKKQIPISVLAHSSATATAKSAMVEDGKRMRGNHGTKLDARHLSLVVEK